MLNKLIANKRIAIIGGGPGGLTLARLLQMNGANVTVYERDLNKDSRAKGATLDLHEESGLKALGEAELMDAFKANYRPGADRLIIMDKNANVLLDEHDNEGDKLFREGDLTFRPEIDRGPLQTILLDSLQPGTVVWDSHFISLTPQNDSWKLEFKNGASVVADIVIGADGANSKVRPYITPIKPFYAGVTAVEGVVYNSKTAIPKIHTLLNGGKIFAMGDEKGLVVSSKGDGSLVFYTSGKMEENWIRECGIDFNNKAQVLAWFKKEYTGWAGVWLELFENADTHFVPRPIYSMPLDQTWEALANLTMLGDAAHLMTPFAGEGVNMAMMDALELSHCLTGENFDTLQSAIASYEKEIRIRASAAAKDSLDSQDVLHSNNALTFLLDMMSQINPE